MASIHSLPSELLDQIFGYLTRHQTLALVCRAWRAPAQRALFSRVCFCSVQQALAWMSAPARSRFQTTHLHLRAPDVGPTELAAGRYITSLTLDENLFWYHWCTSWAATGAHL